MRLSKNTRTAFNETVQVDNYELVAALRHRGFEMPKRLYAWVSEDIAKEALDDVVNDSVYVYSSSPELLAAINQIKYAGMKIDRKDWKFCLDELKAWFGIGPSKLGNFTAEEVNGRIHITSRG